ncbi:MAG: hypothetical protein VX090_14635 [Pseudomonadota bacterium]|nr:hypothetical protein [Pseudomonadota bacterium]
MAALESLGGILGLAIVFGDDLGLFALGMAAGLFFVLVMGVMPVAIIAVTAGLRHSELAGGQQDARMLF